MLIILLSRHSCRKMFKKILYNLIKIIFVTLLKKLFDNATSTIMVSSASGHYNLNQARSGFPLISRKNLLSYRYIPYNKSLLTKFARFRWLVNSLNIFGSFMDLDWVQNRQQQTTIFLSRLVNTGTIYSLLFMPVMLNSLKIS